MGSRVTTAFCLALASCAAGCDADAHIRLFVPRGDAATDAMAPSSDAGRLPPDAALPAASGRGGNGGSAGSELRDAGGNGPPGAVVSDLVLRYDFSGSGTVVRDLVGDADAQLIGGATLASDRDFITLDGVDDYVDMPNGVISGLRNATFVAWVAWDGGPCWQRIFDFGISDAGEDQVGNVVTSLFMTPQACGVSTFTAMAELGRVQYPVSADEALPAGYTIQVALAVDSDRQTFTLYRDNMRVAQTSTPFQLGELTDTNNWLGRSQWVQDRFFSGIYGEFRIYARALSDAEIATLYSLGPNRL
jgi:hypothetical protein